ncbi:hypothetical protein AHF37_03454 [Paragonimus kellicotti]|nr:hypothetical protein AHF37_03454 [Paragonimus kellicotti]
MSTPAIFRSNVFLFVIFPTDPVFLSPPPAFLSGAASLTPSLTGTTPYQRSGVPTTRSGLNARGTTVKGSPTRRISSTPVTSCITTTTTTAKTATTIIRTTQRRSSDCTLKSVNSQRTAPSALDVTKIGSTAKPKQATTKYGLAISTVVSPSITGTVTSKSNIRSNTATHTKCTFIQC